MRKVILLLTIVGFIGSVIWFYFKPNFDSGLSSISFLIAIFGLLYSMKKKKESDVDIILTLGRKHKDIKDYSKYLKFSFIRKDFIHPKIIEDLQGWISDIGEQIVSINLLDSQSSNRYFEKINLEKPQKGHPIVSYKSDHSNYGYVYIGTSESGINILRTISSGDGSGIFNYIIFLTFEKDECVNFVDSETTKKVRINIKTLGLLSLGDRYDGDIKFEKGILVIGKDRGLFSKRNKPKERRFKVS